MVLSVYDYSITNICKLYNLHKKQSSLRLSRAEEKIKSIEFSSRAKDFVAIAKVLDTVDDIRQDKVNEIKDKIDNNMYDVSSEKIAKKILEI